VSNPVTEQMTHRVDRSVGAELQSAIARRLDSWTDARVAARLWQKDGSLWAASGKQSDELAAWLGWLDLPTSMRDRLSELTRLAGEVRRDGYTRAAVLGMGGSSLAPELFSRVFGFGAGAAAPGSDGLELRILDSTHPDAVRGFREWATAARTIFCVSSKSGTTTEPNAFHAAMAAEAPALDFIAITDPGTALADLARSQEFRAIVEAPPDVGGRYSALTVFGLLPAALHGVDLDALLQRAAAMAQRCREAPADNPGLRLGAYLGEAALAGRDKLTILASSRLASLGDWVEQLIAESTGKQGTGIVPIVGEPIGEPERYGDDRCFVLVTLADDPDTEWRHLSEALIGRGHPFLHIELADALDVGGEFIRWEVATAAAGMILGIDPFDQPNVQESKDATKRLLAAARETGRLSSPAPLVATEGMALYGDPDAIGGAPLTVDGGIRQLLDLASVGDYFALLAYLPRDRDTEALLQRIRAQLRDALGIATTLGFGPRFLHSTGQLHKGGPGTGIYLQITAEPQRDLPIPGWDETFGLLIAAEALGDLQSLQRRQRRALRLHLADADAGLPRLEEMVADALPGLLTA
jgi:glucose-6-phosphate isomerase